LGSVLLAAMETQVRTDLKDLDSSAYLWTTVELDRHIQHAVNDYQRVMPLVGAVVIAVVASTTVGSSVPITTRQTVADPVTHLLPGGYLWALRIEYPIDQEPPVYLIFREEVPDMGTYYFPGIQPPNVGDNMRVWHGKTHTLSTTVSTILIEHEELIGLGATAWATQAAARYAQGRLNASAWTPKGMQAFATERMAAYKLWLSELEESYAPSGLPIPQWGDFPSDWNSV
jgi:hypothetical protein